MFSKIFSERATLALALFLVAVALTLSTFGLQFAQLGGAFDPMFFPRIVLFAWLGLAAVNLLVDARSGAGWQAMDLWRVVPMAVAMVLYAIFLTALGFFASSVVLSVLFLLLLGVKSPVAIAGVSIGVPGALVALFNHVLKMPLPTSPVFWWI